ncbi:MAG: hypothetical protein WCP15_01810 [bacterium]
MKNPHKYAILAGIIILAWIIFFAIYLYENKKENPFQIEQPKIDLTKIERLVGTSSALSINDVDFKKVLYYSTYDEKNLASEMCVHGQEPIFINSLDYADVDGDEKEEAILSVTSCFTGNAGPDIQGIYRLTSGKVYELKINNDGQGKFSMDNVFAKSRSPGNYTVLNGVLYYSFMLYNEDDPQCCATGGSIKIQYKWTGTEFDIFNVLENLTVDKPIDYKMLPTSDGKNKYPQIINFADKDVMDSVNKVLSDSFKNFGCGPTDDTGEPTLVKDPYWNMEITVDYAKNDIFSVNEHGSYYCNPAAYPTNKASYTMTFDMKTGEQVYFNDLFTNYDADQESIIKTVYGDLIARTEKYIKENPNSEENKCKALNTFEMLSDYYIMHDFRLSSTPKEISVRPGYSHAAESCIEDVVVPIEKLKPFYDETSILDRI